METDHTNCIFDALLSAWTLCAHYKYVLFSFWGFTLHVTQPGYMHCIKKHSNFLLLFYVHRCCWWRQESTTAKTQPLSCFHAHRVWTVKCTPLHSTFLAWLTTHRAKFTKRGKMASEHNPQIVLAGVVSFISNVQIYFTVQEKLKNTVGLPHIHGQFRITNLTHRGPPWHADV